MMMEIPDKASFQPIEVAVILGRDRRTIASWMISGKLGWVYDYRRKKVVMRAELERFIRDFLDR